MRVRPVKVDTYKENVIFLRKDCPLCRAQGFAALSKVEVRCNGRSVIGVLNVIDESFLAKGEVGLCEYAFRNLGAKPGAEVEVRVGVRVLVGVGDGVSVMRSVRDSSQWRSNFNLTA